MDAHFNAYKARYEILDQHIRFIAQTQYVKSMDIFINLDDVLHNMHRPIVEKEVQACGINAVKQLAVHVVNLLAHYRQWASRRRISCRIFAIYTSNRGRFKNGIYLPAYRDYHSVISDPANTQYFLTNDAIGKGLPIAKNIADYVRDIFIVDSHYLEPSIIPLFLTEQEVANYDWKMMISRDMYDLQYAYRDKWIFVSPKGDNTRIITRADLWKYVGAHEHIVDIGANAAFYDQDIYPLALAVNGNKLRTIPRLKRIGWRTIFKYLNQITEKDTSFLQILAQRFLTLLEEKGVDPKAIDHNLSCVNIQRQVSVMNDIDATSITDQLKYVTDHEALATINKLYFQQFPINIPFLTADFQTGRAFF